MKINNKTTMDNYNNRHGYKSQNSIMASINIRLVIKKNGGGKGREILR